MKPLFLYNSIGGRKYLTVINSIHAFTTSISVLLPSHSKDPLYYRYVPSNPPHRIQQHSGFTENCSLKVSTSWESMGLYGRFRSPSQTKISLTSSNFSEWSRCEFGDCHYRAVNSWKKIPESCVCCYSLPSVSTRLHLQIRSTPATSFCLPLLGFGNATTGIFARAK